jgi:CubicO group peptidase (beta-lactamase class C family)
MHPGWLSPVRLLAAIAAILPVTGSAGAESPVPPGDRLAALEAYAKTAQAQWGIPGMAIAIVKDDQVLYAKGFGVKRVGGTAPVGPDTVFEIGSTSKAFTAAVVAMQVDDGKVRWSDRVVDHLPGFEVRDPWVTREFRSRT